jgi:hypothetical protein
VLGCEYGVDGKVGAIGTVYFSPTIRTKSGQSTGGRGSLELGSVTPGTVEGQITAFVKQVFAELGSDG